MKKFPTIVCVTMLLLILVARVGWCEETEPVREVLDNGMTVILLENHNAPVVTIQAWVNAGSLTEQEFMGSGISHFVEHMLFKGTDRRSVGQIGQEVKEAGGETNAHTGYDKTVYYITFHSDYFDKALDIMADVIMHSAFDPSEVEREREVIIKEIKMNRDDPFRRLYLMSNEVAFAVHPYQYPVIGYESLFRRVTRDDLLKYYHRLYVPNNMTLIIVGDFKADAALPQIRDLFRDFERKPIAPITIPQEPPQTGLREKIDAFDVTVAQSMIGFHGPSLNSGDMYPMDVLAIVLGGGDTSRLYRELREKRGLVYTISAWSSTPRDPGMFWIASSYEPENYANVKNAVWEQIEKLRSSGVTDEELSTARAKVLSQYLFARESVEGRADSLGSGELDAHNMDFDKQYVESVGRVTKDDISRVVNEYFKPENSVIAMLTPAGKEISGKTESGGEPQQAPAPGIEKLTLPNGLTLLLREDHSVQTVALRLSILGGARDEDKNNTGITSLMSKTMLKGTTTRSAEQIASDIESKGGSIDSFAGYNSFGFDVSMLSRDIETGIDVLSDVVANPSFPAGDVEREKTAALANIKSVDDDIFPASVKLFRQTMFDGHPYSFQVNGEADTVKTLTPDDLKKFHSQSVTASRMVLAVFGDVDKHKVIELIQKSFGQIESGAGLTVERTVIPFPETIKKAHKFMNKEQAAVLIGFPGISVDNPDRYALDVLSSFLNSQGGRLFQVLRDERGLAYSVGAFDILGLDPGAFVFYIFTVPEKRAEATDGLLEVIRNLREKGLTNQELERAKVEVMGKHAIDLQTNSQIASEASFDELYGQGYDNYERYDSKIRSLTVDDIRRVASQMFNLNRYAIIDLGNYEGP
ncbi:insulinase family protein [Candidatus Poribacteria bacterium]|nr:insulinase family protein [Candidatus Poribacteria bacterium]